MANDINNLEISKFFGIDISNREIPRKNVSIYEQALKLREEKMARYQKDIKKNRHSSVVDKLKNISKNHTLSDNEIKRREALTEAFKKTKKWMEGFSNYFWFCKENETTEKYVKQINKDYKALKKKGYVPEIPDKDFEKFSQTYKLNLAEKDDDNKNRNVSYASYIANIYKDLCDSFYQSLNNNSNAFKNIVQTAENAQRISTDIFADIARYADDIMTKYEKSHSDLESIIKKYKIKKDSRLETKRKYLMREYDEGKDGLDLSIHELARLRSRATFAWVYADDANTNISEVLANYQRLLNDFYKTATGKNGKYNIEDLRDKYIELKGKRLDKVNRGLNQFLTGSDVTTDSRTTISERVNGMIKQIEKTFKEIGAKKSKFDKEVTEFHAKCDEWKREQKERKTKVALYAAFGIFGGICGSVKAFYPLIDAAMFPVKSDDVIGPMPK